MRNVCITVYGKVQHKGFRFTAMQVAYQRGVRGYIKNQKDGSLFIEAEAEEEPLNGFIEWCKRGSVWAKVENIEVIDGEFKGYNSFDIL